MPPLVKMTARLFAGATAAALDSDTMMMMELVVCSFHHWKVLIWVAVAITFTC